MDDDLAPPEELEHARSQASPVRRRSNNNRPKLRPNNSGGSSGHTLRAAASRLNLITRSHTDITDLNDQITTQFSNILDEPYLVNRHNSSLLLGDDTNDNNNNDNTQTVAKVPKPITKAEQRSYRQLMSLASAASSLTPQQSKLRIVTSTDPEDLDSTSNTNNNENCIGSPDMMDDKNRKKRASNALLAFNTARMAIVNSLTQAAKHDRMATQREFPVDTVCHPSVEVSMKQKVRKLNKNKSGRNVVDFGGNGGNSGNNSGLEMIQLKSNEVTPAESGAEDDGNNNNADGRQSFLKTRTVSNGLSPKDIDRIEQFNVSGDIFDLTSGLRGRSIYTYNFRPVLYILVSMMLAALSVYADVKGAYISLSVLIFQSSLAVIGTICNCLNLHIKYVESNEKKTDGSTNTSMKAIQLADNFFDVILNVENSYLLVPSPYGRNIVYGWVYVSFIVYLANIYSENRTRWIDFCKDDDYASDDAISSGSCLVRHACFSVLMSFGSFSLGTAMVLLPRVKGSARETAFQAKVILLSKFNNVGVYFDRVRERIRRKIKYISDYRVDCLKLPVPWLAILAIVLLVPIACGTLFIEREFYIDVEAGHRRSSRLIFWLCVPFTAVIMFGGISVVWRLYNLYKINYLTMRTLRHAISVDSVVDLVEWWEVRKYYLYYVMPIRYTFGSYGFLYVFVLSTVLILAAFFMIVLFEDPVFKFVFGQGAGFLTFVSTVGLVFSMVRIMRMAVAVHLAQRSHVRMLEHERVRLEYLAVVYGYQHQHANNSNDKEEANDDHEVQEIGLIAQNCRKLVIGMIDVIDNHDMTPKIMGIPMRPSVMIAFLTYIIAAVISISTKIIVG